MKTEIVKVNPSEFGIEEKKASELMGNLPQIKAERKILEEQYSEVIKMDIEEPATSETAKKLRLLIRDNRTKGIEVWHKTTKNFFLKGGQFVDSIKKMEVAENLRMEENLEKIEKHFENMEKKRIQDLHEERIAAVAPYVEDVSGLQFGTMDADVFNAYLTAKKTAYEERIEAERIAEEKRIAAEKAEAEARELQRIENERLKAEAKKREKEIEEERKKQADILARQKAEADKKAKEESEKQAKIQAEKDAELQRERDAKAKIEAELKAKKDAEEKAEIERLAEEKRLKAEADKLAKAPIKKQMTIWVDGFSLPTLNAENEKKKLIEQKFEAFKKWAKSEIENL